MEQETGLQDITKNKKGIVIYFYNTSCSSCEVLRPKVRAMVDRAFPGLEFKEINAPDHPKITAEASVYSSPSIVVFFEGKETLRESRYISVSQLEEKIERYYNMLF